MDNEAIEFNNSILSESVDQLLSQIVPERELLKQKLVRAGALTAENAWCNSSQQNRINERRNLQTYFFYSKPHNVWFMCNLGFIKQYDPEKSLEDLVVVKEFYGRDRKPLGFFGFYNKDEKIQLRILNISVKRFLNINK